MSKHETSNQFKDGLMMDVHPLQTPNTVLTDCLNGTFITYNGNEYVLQNDMGNFKLSKCKLKENYLPVGTTSYGDILYIASYNPIEDRFEIGSYPSPLQWNSNDGKNYNNQLTSIIDKAKEKGLKELNYTESGDYAETILFDSEELKLNPGDEYQISSTDSETYVVEDFEYFIIDDNNVQHKIAPKQDKRQAVDWEIPGYLGVKNSILTPYESTMYLNKAKSSSNEVQFTITCNLNIQNEALCRKLSNFKKLLRFKIYNSNCEANLNFNESDIKELDWLSNRKQLSCTIVVNVSFDNDNDDNKKEIPINLSIVPQCVLGDFTINYDNLIGEITYVINGDNKTTVAVNQFSFSQKELTFDVNRLSGNDGDDEISYCGPIKLPNTTPEASNWKVINGTGICSININIEENELYVIVFKITNDNETRYVGRYIYYSGDLEYFSGRMDVLNNHVQEIKNLINKYKPSGDKIIFENTKKPKLNNNVVDVNNLFFDEELGDTGIVTHVYKTSQESFSSELKESGLWSKFQIEYLFSDESYNPISLSDVEIQKNIKYSMIPKLNKVCYIPIKSVSNFNFNEDSMVWSLWAAHSRDGFFKGLKVTNETFIRDWTKGGIPSKVVELLQSSTGLMSEYGVSKEYFGGHTFITGYDKKFQARSKNDVDTIKEQTMLCVDTNGAPIIIHFSNSLYEKLKNSVYDVVFDSNELYWKYKYLYELVDLGNSENYQTPFNIGGSLTSDDTYGKWLMLPDDKKHTDSSILGWISGVNPEFDENSRIQCFNYKSNFEKWESDFNLSGIEFEDELRAKWKNCVEDICNKYNKNLVIYKSAEALLNTHNDLNGKLNRDSLYWTYSDNISLLDPEYKFLYLLKKNENKIVFDSKKAAQLRCATSPGKCYFIISRGYGKYQERVNIGPMNYIKYNNWNER